MTAPTNTMYGPECSSCGSAPAPLRLLVGWRGWTFIRCRCGATSAALTTAVR